MNPRYKYGIWPGMRSSSVGVFRAREIRRLEPRRRWDTEAVNSVIGVPRSTTDGKWTVDRPEVRVHPIPIPPLPFDGARCQRERVTKQDIDAFGATIGCPGCNAITNDIQCERDKIVEIKSVLSSVLRERQCFFDDRALQRPDHSKRRRLSE